MRIIAFFLLCALVFGDDEDVKIAKLESFAEKIGVDTGGGSSLCTGLTKANCDLMFASCVYKSGECKDAPIAKDTSSSAGASQTVAGTFAAPDVSQNSGTTYRDPNSMSGFSAPAIQAAPASVVSGPLAVDNNPTGLMVSAGSGNVANALPAAPNGAALLIAGSGSDPLLPAGSGSGPLLPAGSGSGPLLPAGSGSGPVQSGAGMVKFMPGPVIDTVDAQQLANVGTPFIAGPAPIIAAPANNVVQAGPAPANNVVQAVPAPIITDPNNIVVQAPVVAAKNVGQQPVVAVSPPCTVTAADLVGLGIDSTKADAIVQSINSRALKGTITESSCMASVDDVQNLGLSQKERWKLVRNINDNLVLNDDDTAVSVSMDADSYDEVGASLAGGSNNVLVAVVSGALCGVVGFYLGGKRTLAGAEKEPLLAVP